MNCDHCGNSGWTWGRSDRPALAGIAVPVWCRCVRGAVAHALFGWLP